MIGGRWSVVGGAFGCFVIARSLRPGACKPLPRDNDDTIERVSLVPLALSTPTDSIRAPSSKLKAPSYEEAVSIANFVQ